MKILIILLIGVVNITTSTQYGGTRPTESANQNQATNGQQSSGAITQQTSGGISQQTSGSMSQETSGSISQQSSGATSQQTSGRWSQQSSGETSQQTSGGWSQQTSGGTSQQTSGGTSQQTSGGTSQQTSGGTSQQTSGGTSQQTSGGTSQQTSGGTSQQTNKKETEMILVIGGSRDSGNAKDCVAYVNGKWVQRASLPKGGGEISVSKGFGGKVVASGGYGFGVQSSSYIYDPIKNKWEEGPSMNTARIKHSSVTVGSKVYVFGGWNLRDGYLDSVEVWDSSKGLSTRWEFLSSMDSERGGAGAVFWRGEIYVVGGGRRRARNSGEKYNIDEDEWDSIPDMSNDRTRHGLVVLNDKIYAIGGSRGRDRGALSSCESFNGKRWNTEPSLNEARYGAAVGVLGGKIYVIGGLKRRNRPVNTIEVFDPSSSEWTYVNTTGSPMPLSDCATVVVDIPKTLKGY